MSLIGSILAAVTAPSLIEGSFDRSHYGSHGQGCKLGSMKKSEIIQLLFLRIWIYQNIM